MFVICSQVRNGCVLVSDLNASVCCALQHSLTRLAERYNQHLKISQFAWDESRLAVVSFLKGVGGLYWRWDIAGQHHWWVRIQHFFSNSASSFNHFIQLWLFRKIFLVQICGEDSKEEKSMSHMSLCLREVCPHTPSSSDLFYLVSVFMNALSACL